MGDESRRHEEDDSGQSKPDTVDSKHTLSVPRAIISGAIPVFQTIALYVIWMLVVLSIYSSDGNSGGAAVDEELSFTEFISQIFMEFFGIYFVETELSLAGQSESRNAYIESMSSVDIGTLQYVPFIIPVFVLLYAGMIFYLTFDSPFEWLDEKYLGILTIPGSALIVAFIVIISSHTVTVEGVEASFSLPLFETIAIAGILYPAVFATAGSYLTYLRQQEDSPLSEFSLT